MTGGGSRAAVALVVSVVGVVAGRRGLDTGQRFDGVEGDEVEEGVAGVEVVVHVKVCTCGVVWMGWLHCVWVRVRLYSRID